jgi:uridine kinase
MLDRLLASLLAKPFVILTGLSGSGKTKIANALAVWLSEERVTSRDPFVVGSEIKSDRISYYVEASSVQNSKYLPKHFKHTNNLERSSG